MMNLFAGGKDGFWNNTGFMFDIAPLFQAMVVFCEHVIREYYYFFSDF